MQVGFFGFLGSFFPKKSPSGARGGASHFSFYMVGVWGEAPHIYLPSGRGAGRPAPQNRSPCGVRPHIYLSPSAAAACHVGGASGALLALRRDLARFGKRDLCGKRTAKLIYQNCKQYDIAYIRSVAAKRQGGSRHAEGNALLREQRNPQKFHNGIGAPDRFCGKARAEILAQTSENDEYKSHGNDRRVKEHAEIKLRTADGKKHYVKRSRPAVRSVHKLLGDLAHVAEYAAEHHARKQRRKSEHYRAELYFHA